MNQPTISYKPNSLVITIETPLPAELHHSLMKGINEAIQSYLSNPDKPFDYGDGLAALLKLQKTILPNVAELEKAYE